MSIIETIDENGNKIVLNPKYVVSVIPVKYLLEGENLRFCKVTMLNNDIYTIRDTVENISCMLEYTN